MASHLAAGTSVGLVRTRNEDSAYVGRWLCAVADGMGGHVAGDVASAAVTDALRPFDVGVDSPRKLTGVLGRAVAAASARLAAMIAADRDLAGMGSTLVAMLWTDGHAAVANMGDSRAYLVRRRTLRPITEDHVMSKLVATPSPRHVGAVLVRYLDGRLDRSADLTTRATMPGDRFLICSDGLSGILEPGVVQDVLISVKDADKAVKELIRLTHEAGAPDNVTAIVVDTPGHAWSAAGRNPLLLGAACGATGMPAC